MSGTTLRARLTGTWRLVSYEARKSGGETIFPMGEDLDGRIIYTEDGDVSVHIAAPGRPDLVSGDISEGTNDEWAAAARTYFGYCGTFEVDEERGVVTHAIVLSFIPNWTGQQQVRHAHLSGDRLELSGFPALIASDTRTPHLIWRRKSRTALDGPRPKQGSTFA